MNHSLFHRTWLILLLTSMFIISCVSQQIDFIERDVLITKLNVPLGDYIDIAWLSSDWLIVAYKPEVDTLHPSRDLWQLRIDSGEIHLLELPPNNKFRCRTTFFSRPVVVSSTQFFFERECTTTTGSHSDLISFDTNNQQSQILYPFEMPFGASRYTVSPNQDLMILASNTGMADRLFLLTDKDYNPIDLDMDRARLPTWAPNGKFIAFFGRKEISANLGPDWALEVDSLWLMSADCVNTANSCDSAIEEVLGRIKSHRRVSWSPDSCWLAFDGDYDNNGSGIWLINPTSKTLYRIAVGEYDLPIWSPDGQKLVVVGPPEVVNENSYLDIRPSLYIIDLSNLIEESTC